MTNQHLNRFAGYSVCDSDTGYTIYRMQYGALRDVYADQACNYSYREFWF